MIIFSHFTKISFLNKLILNKMTYLDKINLHILSNGQKQICDAIVTEKEIYDALKSMENDKTPGNDGLSKEFCEVF